MLICRIVFCYCVLDDVLWDCVLCFVFDFVFDDVLWDCVLCFVFDDFV